MPWKWNDLNLTSETMECKILIVDDDPTSLFLHNSLIVKSGLCQDPKQFLNGQEAIEYLEYQRNSQTPFLVLLDLDMPVMNGWEFLEKLESSKFPLHIDVVIVTASIDKSDRQRAKKIGSVASYLTKPIFNLDQVKELVAKIESPSTLASESL